MLKDKPYAALGIEMLKVLPSVAKSGQLYTVRPRLPQSEARCDRSNVIYHHNYNRRLTAPALGSHSQTILITLLFCGMYYYPNGQIKPRILLLAADLCISSAECSRIQNLKEASWSFIECYLSNQHH